MFILQEWYYDEQDMLEMDVYDEPDPDSDYDYEEYSKRKRRKGAGRVSTLGVYANLVLIKIFDVGLTLS